MTNTTPASDLSPRFKEMYRRTAEFHKELIDQLPALIQDNLKAESLEALADIRFVTYHLERLGKEIKKKLCALDDIAIKATCLRWSNSNLEGHPIRTDYATFSPSVTEIPKLPSAKEEPEKYQACLKALGVPDEVIATDMVHISWGSLKDWKENLDLNGLPMPEEFGDQLYPVYAVRVSHKKKEVLE